MDPVADMLNQIKTASKVGKESASFSHSKIKESIANLLETSGYIKSVAIGNDKKFGKRIEVKLAFKKSDGTMVPKISDITRVSKPSKRVYRGAQEIVPVNQGHGLAIVSTNKGLMTDTQARKSGLGGELLCKIW